MIALMLALLAQDALKVEDLIPQKEGFRWVYDTGAGDAVSTIAGRQKVGDVDCLVVKTDGKSGTMVELWRVASDGLFLHRMGAEDLSPPIPRLKGGTKKGDTWEWKGKDGTVRWTNDGVVEVKVAAGTFKAWKITVSGGGLTGSLWYAPGVGLVLQEFQTDDPKKTTRRELKSYEAPK